MPYTHEVAAPCTSAWDTLSCAWPPSVSGSSVICRYLILFARYILETRKPTQPGVENDASTRPPDLPSVSWDLDLWPFDPRCWSFHTLTACDTCGNLYPNPLICLQNIMFASLVTGEQADRQMSEWTQVEMCFQSTCQFGARDEP